MRYFDARSKTPPEASSAKKLKQQSITRSVKPLQYWIVTGPEVKASHQWKVVEFIIGNSLPFKTVEGSLFRSLP